MRQLLDHLNSLSRQEQAAFARRCETTVGYLRKAISVGQKIRAETCINIERESCGAVPCEAVRPDVDWATVRKRQNPPPALTHQAPVAINSEACLPAREVSHEVLARSAGGANA